MKIMMTPSLVARRTLIPMNAQMGMAKTRMSVTMVKVNVEKPKAGGYMRCWTGRVSFQYAATGIVCKMTTRIVEIMRPTLMALITF